jgi:tryptophan halogenase
MFGQGIMPKSYHKVFATMSDQELNAHLQSIRSKILEVAAKVPNHDFFISQYCKAQIS